MAKSDTWSPTIEPESFSPLSPQQESLLGAGARLKHRSRVSGPREIDRQVGAWQNLTQSSGNIVSILCEFGWIKQPLHLTKCRLLTFKRAISAER